MEVSDLEPGWEKDAIEIDKTEAIAFVKGYIENSETQVFNTTCPKGPRLVVITPAKAFLLASKNPALMSYA